MAAAFKFPAPQILVGLKVFNVCLIPERRSSSYFAMFPPCTGFHCVAQVSLQLESDVRAGWRQLWKKQRSPTQLIQNSTTRIGLEVGLKFFWVGVWWWGARTQSF